MSIQLFTARYSNKALAAFPGAKVRTSQGYPRFPLRYPLEHTVKLIAPSRAILKLEDRDEFRGRYFQQLEDAGLDRLRRIFYAIARESESEKLALLCFEDVRKPGVWCHRHLFAEWWEDKTGHEVLEIPEL